MKIYLAAISSVKNAFMDGRLNLSEMNVLESFYSFQDWQKPLIHQFKDFMLDSGAFTFLKSKKRDDLNFRSYAIKYANFIRQNNIDKFFELDIDSLVGIKEVEHLRNEIERIVEKQSIPVWHKNRGKDYFVEMCKNYPYVALGGIALKEIPSFEKIFPWFIETAHKYETKIHGLGFTKMRQLSKFPFDSVDSTTWHSGMRFGELHLFKNGTIIRNRSVVKGVKCKSLKDTNETNILNLNEWMKMCKYAEIFL